MTEPTLAALVAALRAVPCPACGPRPGDYGYERHRRPGLRFMGDSVWEPCPTCGEADTRPGTGQHPTARSLLDALTAECDGDEVYICRLQMKGGFPSWLAREPEGCVCEGYGHVPLELPEGCVSGRVAWALQIGGGGNVDFVTARHHGFTDEQALRLADAILDGDDAAVIAMLLAWCGR